MLFGNKKWDATREENNPSLLERSWKYFCTIKTSKKDISSLYVCMCVCVKTVLTWGCWLNLNFNTVIWRKILRHIHISPKPDIILHAFYVN